MNAILGSSAFYHDSAAALAVDIPTAKNGLVRDHYTGLGFARVGEGEGGATMWRLEVERFRPFEVAIQVVEDY